MPDEVAIQALWSCRVRKRRFVRPSWRRIGHSGDRLSDARALHIVDDLLPNENATDQDAPERPSSATPSATRSTPDGSDLLIEHVGSWWQMP